MFEALACRARSGPTGSFLQDAPRTRTQEPIVTGTTIIAVKFKGGVLMAGDTLGSYGSLARFKDIRRITEIGGILVGGDGEYSDFQYIEKFLKELELEVKCVDDGIQYTANEIYNRLRSLLYARRSKVNPLWNSLVIAGVDVRRGEKGEKVGVPFIGTTDKIGTAYEADYVATGFGLHLAQPILYDKWRPNMSLEEAKKLVEDCLRVCYYRDCRTINKIVFAVATETGARIDDPQRLTTEWNYELFKNP